MACPFSAAFARSASDDEAKNQLDNHPRIGEVRRERTRPSRQSSVQITSSQPGEDVDVQEDTQTLNLKHLREAVLMLTNPSVSKCLPEYKLLSRLIVYLICILFKLGNTPLFYTFELGNAALFL